MKIVFKYSYFYTGIHNIFICQINNIIYISIVISTIEFIEEARNRNYKKFPCIKL